jgi:hypothetical protein
LDLISCGRILYERQAVNFGRAVSSAVRASRLHREGPRFKSVTAHHPPRKESTVVELWKARSSQRMGGGASNMENDELIFLGAAMLLAHVTGHSDTVPGRENETAIRKARELYAELKTTKDNPDDELGLQEHARKSGLL